MLYQLLLQIVSTQLTSVVTAGQPHLLQYDLQFEKNAEKAVKDLLLAARRGSLYVIADEARYTYYIETFCDKLRTQIPHLHFWAASCYKKDAPLGWQLEYLTRPLRSPPAVIREVQQDKEIAEKREVQPYSERGMADHTDGCITEVRVTQVTGQFIVSRAVMRWQASYTVSVFRRIQHLRP